MEKHFQEIIPIETNSRKTIATFSDFEKIQGFFQKDIFFQKNSNFERFEILLLQSHSTAN